MKKYLSLTRVLICAACLLLTIFSNNIFAQACDAMSTNVELTITSIDITGACNGDPPFNTSIEPSISINGQVFTFQPAGSADNGITGSNVNAGNYPVTNGDLIDGCSSSTTLSIGGANGATMVPVTVEAWEEDAGVCTLDSGGINSDDDINTATTLMVDITQATGSFTLGCYTYNYGIACPAPCEANACKEIQICITGAALNEGDGILGNADPTLTIGGNTYQWDNAIDPDGTIQPLGDADATCDGPGPACVTFTTDMNNLNGTTLMGVQAWEEDFDCGSNCTADTGCGFFGDDDDNIVGPSNIALSGVNQDGTFMIGDYTWQYEITSCVQLIELADAGLVISACDDAGTEDDADDTYTFDLNPNIIENVAGSLGANYTITAAPGPAPATTMGNYGAATTFGPLLIADGAQTITVADASGCLTFDVLVSPPAACSMVIDCTIPSGTWSK